MNSTNTKLSIMCFPQRLELSRSNLADNELICNVLILPRYNPLVALESTNPHGMEPFSTASLGLNPFVVTGDFTLPVLGETMPFNNNFFPGPGNRDGLFNSLKSSFEIKDDLGKGQVFTKFTRSVIKKYLPQAYRDSFNFIHPKPNTYSDDSYFCSLKKSEFQNLKSSGNEINWGMVYSFCLHQPVLAEKLGLLQKGLKVKLPSFDLFKDGGWIYFNFASGQSYNGLSNTALQIYAARIPSTVSNRQIFSSHIFAVDSTPISGNFDEVFKEVIKYDDGFAKIVHSSQVLSTNHLAENTDGNPPALDTGIRLGWDDEQLVGWLNRNFEQAASNLPMSPLGVSNYRIDVAKATDKTQKENELDWRSQVCVTSEKLNLNGIELDEFTGELGVDVAPSKHSNGDEFWLPAYFTHWNGNSLVLPDTLASDLNHVDDSINAIKNKMGAQKRTQYNQRPEDKLDLKYGEMYAFRVRLSDLSGGGPGPEEMSIHPGQNKISFITFKRFVAPFPPKVVINQNELIVTRPRLSYPAVLYTKVDTQKAIKALFDDRKVLDNLYNEYKNNNTKLDKLLESSRAVSLPDPDVDTIQIIVEVKTLEMDREASYNAKNNVKTKEPYIFLYETFRKFPNYKLGSETDNDIVLNLNFKPVEILSFDADDINDVGLGAIKNDTNILTLPAGREIRISIRSFCGTANDNYFEDNEFKFSIAAVNKIRKNPESLESGALLNEPSDSNDKLVSLYFQNNKPLTPLVSQTAKMGGFNNQIEVNIVEQLASITKLKNYNMSLTGKDNLRTQIGCSKYISHILSPDHSSITFSNKSTLINHWINIIQLDIERDWTWDMLLPNSFKVLRKWKFENETDDKFRIEDLGGVYLTKGLNWQSMDLPDRSKTKLIFFDSLDPKCTVGKFPEPIEIEYLIEPQLQNSDTDGIKKNFLWNQIHPELKNKLPITQSPLQVPKIVSAGIALSPYISEEELLKNNYSETSDRTKYLWIEFEKPIEDPKDQYYSRILAYAPDPMLADDNHITDEDPEVDSYFADLDRIFMGKSKINAYEEQKEDSIKLDPEQVRIIRPGQINDNSGEDAMQVMIPSNSEDSHPKHFILQLPHGLNHDSEELFGFFTFEFRVGHHDIHKWSTAQGRFGRSIRATGIQFPPPNLHLNVIRRNNKIIINSRYARSFFKGKDVTPQPPRTNILGLLYAQVLQADGKHYRNILIDQIVCTKPKYSPSQKNSIDISKLFTEGKIPTVGSGQSFYGFGYWDVNTIQEKLRFLSLSVNSSLSVLALEVMPLNNHPNFYQKVPPLDFNDFSMNSMRILRTSRLCKVSDACPVED